MTKASLLSEYGIKLSKRVMSVEPIESSRDISANKYKIKGMRKSLLNNDLR